MMKVNKESVKNNENMGRPISWPEPTTDMAIRLQQVLPQFGKAKLARVFFAGISEGGVKSILSGKSEPPPSALKRIAEIQGCDLNWLAWGDENTPPAEAGGDIPDLEVDQTLMVASRTFWALNATLQHVYLRAVERRLASEEFADFLIDLIHVLKVHKIDLLTLQDEAHGNGAGRAS